MNALLDASAATGVQISLVASESSGASNTRTVTATGAVTAVTGLWPAILADTGATVLVTANALRLLRVDLT